MTKELCYHSEQKLSGNVLLEKTAGKGSNRRRLKAQKAKCFRYNQTQLVRKLLSVSQFPKLANMRPCHRLLLTLFAWIPATPYNSVTAKSNWIYAQPNHLNCL